MLTELRIRNFAIIEEVGLEFSEGFTVLTGETGAGKSILIDAVNLLVGGRAVTDLIRTDEDEAEVSGVFILPDHSPIIELLKDQDLMGAGGMELIVRRILSRSGRHRVYVNGRPAPLAVLQAICAHLIDIHGQHDQQSLFKPSVHLDLVDAFGGFMDLRTRYQNAFEQMREAERRLEERRGVGADRRAREELLRYQVEEITGAHIRPAEDRELEHERLLLSEGRRLAELVQQVYGPLYEEERSIAGALRALATPFKEIAAIDTELAGDRERFETATAELLDIAYWLRAYRDRLECDPERLDKIEERLDLLHRLIRKYGGSLEEVVRRGDDASKELKDIENFEADIADLVTTVTQTRSDARTHAESLSKKRQKAAGDLEKQLEKELKALHMERAKVQIALESSHQDETDGLTFTGIDRVQFLFSANLGEPPQPLSRIASGGELSRVMLALKSVLAEADQVPVLVFDEVDAGIGGAVADVVGKRLHQLSRHRHQVFCITHLAPIAARAHHHFAVAKGTKGGRTVTNVMPLDGDHRVEEVARMLGGTTITPKIRDTAAEMLRTGQR